MPSPGMAPPLLLVLLLVGVACPPGLGQPVSPLYPVLVPPPGFDLPGAGGPAPCGRPLLTVEVFLDLSCGASKVAWEVMQEVVPAYRADQLAVRVYMFPLPYHRHAMTCSQLLLMVKEQVPEQLVSYVDMVFEHLDDWSTSATGNRTDEDVLGELADLTEHVTGITAESVRRRNQEWNRRARAEWKLGALRGVAGTPTFFVNGVPLYLTDLTQPTFKAFLDGLLEEAGPVGGGVELRGGPSEGTVGGDLGPAASSARSTHSLW